MHANSSQYVGGALIIKKCEHIKKIIDIFFKTLDYDNLLVTDYYNNKGQDPFFKENRHDQSILSLICKQYGSFVIQDEINTDGCNYKDLDPPFIATRKKN